MTTKKPKPLRVFRHGRDSVQIPYTYRVDEEGRVFDSQGRRVLNGEGGELDLSEFEEERDDSETVVRRG